MVKTLYQYCHAGTKAWLVPRQEGGRMTQARLLATVREVLEAVGLGPHPMNVLGRSITIIYQDSSSVERAHGIARGTISGIVVHMIDGRTRLQVFTTIPALIDRQLLYLSLQFPGGTVTAHLRPLGFYGGSSTLEVSVEFPQVTEPAEAVA